MMLLDYGLIDARSRASEKELPVSGSRKPYFNCRFERQEHGIK